MNLEMLKKKYNFPNVLFCKSGSECFTEIFRSVRHNDYDEVIVPVTLCYSVIKEIIKAKLIPVFVDIDKNFQISINEIQREITEKTKAIIYVNQYGYLQNYTSIHFKNKKGESIINILDNAQCSFQSYDRNFDYIVYSFNKGKPITVDGGLGMLISNHNLQIKDCNNHANVDFTKMDNFSSSFQKRVSIANIIKKTFGSQWEFVNLENSSMYRFVCYKKEFNKKSFGKFENDLYAFQKINNMDICQTTIDVAPFQRQNVKQYIKKHTNRVPKNQKDFINYNNLASQTLYFKIYENINELDYKKICKYILDYKYNSISRM